MKALFYFHQNKSNNHTNYHVNIIIVATMSQILAVKRWPNFNNKEIQGDYQQTLPQ
jgi:hypothetical protein